MRHVEIPAFIRGHDVQTVFDTLADFRHYAELVDVVREVEVDRRPDGTVFSRWEVEFRNGLLRWTEQDWFRRDTMRLDFVQVEGDFDEFSGGWVLKPTPDGVHAALVVDFDFGVPSLASIVEPVAERVLTDVTHQILSGLFGASAEFVSPALAAGVCTAASDQSDSAVPSDREPKPKAEPKLEPMVEPMVEPHAYADTGFALPVGA